ncbi:MAG TPA: TonB-dependent receptor, partial [Hyphomicrobium sp.]|nr:TonB-dependent receptor [Hyphomicrobium sp.]
MKLPAVEVTAATAKKKVAKKSAAKKAAPAATAPLPGLPTANASSNASASGEGGSKPGLNLDAPASSGSRLGLTPLETPASVEVISGDTIRERGQTSVNEAITQNATGFTSTSAPGNGNSGLTTRGFSGHGSVMRLYDGTRLYAGAGTVTFPFNTWNAERIEVLRGPASVLYGEGAIGGVINVVPKKPTDYFTSEGEVAIGTDGQRRFGVGAGGPASDRLSYRFDIAGAQGDGWKSPNGEWSELAMSGAVKLKAAPGLTFTLSHDYGDQHPMPYFGTPLAANERRPERFRDMNFNASDSKVDFIDNWTQFKTVWEVNEAVTLRNVAYYLTTDRHWRNIERYAFNANTGRIDRSDYLEIYHEQEQLGNRFDATVKHDLLGMKNDIVVGFDVNRIEFTGISNSPYIGSSSIDPWNFDPGSFYDPTGQAPTIPRSTTETFQYALFAEDRLALTDQLSIVGGIRFERPTIDRTDLITGARVDKDFATTTWRAGVVYTPVEGLAFYGQYATGVDALGNLVTLSP